MDDPNLPILLPIVEALDDLCESLVFVGGCATGLLLTAQRAQSIRPTLDVDVVAHVVSMTEYHAMERHLEARGFNHDLSDDAPVCRWIRDGVLLDMMPSEPGILGLQGSSRRLTNLLPYVFAADRESIITSEDIHNPATQSGASLRIRAGDPATRIARHHNE